MLDEIALDRLLFDFNGGNGFHGAGGDFFNAASGIVTLSNSIIADSTGDNCAGSAIDASLGDNI
ncbi:MAG: hypothetical protein HOP18_00970 [Deltaproteobacteria bacterium]|nr:hypothetical protein [Deltaproteobacteria bacterium]